MARVGELIEKEAKRNSVHDVVEASYQIFGKDGAVYLQIDTYGSPTREHPAKTSQSLQFGPDGIAALRDILSKLP